MRHSMRIHLRFLACAAAAVVLLGSVEEALAQNPLLVVPDVVETVPNTIKLIGPSKTEAVIEADVIIERVPCKTDVARDFIRKNGTGPLRLRLLVNAEGYVARAKIVGSSGFRELDRAAMLGYMGCKFEPALKDGVPSEMWVEMQYEWKMD
jgi:TonB family protein